MRFVLLMLVVFSGVVSAADFSVGVSPSLINVGDVRPGEQKLVKFSIFTVSDEPLLVYLGAENGDMNFFSTGNGDMKPRFSEEPTATWVEFINNPAEIDVSNKTAGRGWKDISFLINVPATAEPGYHVITILPRPATYGDPNAPVATTIVAVTKATVLLNVAGNANRGGVVLDTTAHYYSTAGFTLKTFFQNTGTITMLAHAESKIYDGNGTFIGEFSSANEYSRPQNVTVFVTPVNRATGEGEYAVSSKVVFTTGEAAKDSTIRLSPEAAAEPQKEEFPWIIVILIIGAAIILIIAARWFSGKRV